VDQRCQRAVRVVLIVDEQRAIFEYLNPGCRYRMILSLGRRLPRFKRLRKGVLAASQLMGERGVEPRFAGIGDEFCQCRIPRRRISKALSERIVIRLQRQPCKK
jgi:hypothetical protein